MKKYGMKRTLSFVLALALVFTMALALPTNAQAASKSITLTKKSVSVYVGKSATVKVKSVKGLKSKTVTWKTSNSKIATVKNGKITGKAKGKATITATSKSSKSVKATCKVTVKQQVTSIQTASKLTIQKGKKATIHAVAAPSTATSKKLTYKTSKKSVATVTSKGVITGKKVGTAKITVAPKDGVTKKAKKTIAVKVVKKLTPVSKIKLNATSATINKGGSTTLKATVTPTKATSKTVYWVSSNPAIATVTTKGKVTGKAAGTATITAYATDNSGKKASCKVTVKIPVSKVTLNKTSVTLTSKGQTEQLTATVAPTNATNKTVTWSSSKPGVATVSASGKVTAVANGTTIITASADGKTATCNVSVAIPAPQPTEVKPTGVTLDEDDLSMVEGTTEQLTATVAPANATNREVKWKSDDTSVVTVAPSTSTSGAKVTVTAVREGTAKITATTSNGIEKSCTVTVTKKNAVDTSSTANTVITLSKTETAYDVLMPTEDDEEITRTINMSALKEAETDYTNAWEAGITEKYIWDHVTERVAKEYIGMIAGAECKTFSKNDNEIVVKAVSGGVDATVTVTKTESGYHFAVVSEAKASANRTFDITDVKTDEANAGEAQTITATVKGSQSVYNVVVKAEETKVTVNRASNPTPALTIDFAGDNYVITVKNSAASKEYAKLNPSTLVTSYDALIEGLKIYSK